MRTTIKVVEKDLRRKQVPTYQRSFYFEFCDDWNRFPPPRLTITMTISYLIRYHTKESANITRCRCFLIFGNWLSLATNIRNSFSLHVTIYKRTTQWRARARRCATTRSSPNCEPANPNHQCSRRLLRHDLRFFFYLFIYFNLHVLGPRARA